MLVNDEVETSNNNKMPSEIPQVWSKKDRMQADFYDYLVEVERLCFKDPGNKY